MCTLTFIPEQDATELLCSRVNALAAGTCGEEGRDFLSYQSPISSHFSKNVPSMALFMCVTIACDDTARVTSEARSRNWAGC